MAHPISPVQYRAGKTFAWRTNVIISSPTSGALIGPGDMNLATGIELVMKHMLANYRIFSVRSTIAYSEKTGRVGARVLYVPRIKLTPRAEDMDDQTRQSIAQRAFFLQNGLSDDVLLSYFVYLHDIIEDEDDLLPHHTASVYKWARAGERGTWDFNSRFFRGSVAKRYRIKGSRNKTLSIGQKKFYRLMRSARAAPKKLRGTLMSRVRSRNLLKAKTLHRKLISQNYLKLRGGTENLNAQISETLGRLQKQIKACKNRPDRFRSLNRIWAKALLIRLEKIAAKAAVLLKENPTSLIIPSLLKRIKSSRTFTGNKAALSRWYRFNKIGLTALLNTAEKDLEVGELRKHNAILLAALKSYYRYRVRLFTAGASHERESLLNTAKEQIKQKNLFYRVRMSKWPAGIKKQDKEFKHKVRAGGDKQLLAKYRSTFVFFKRVIHKFRARRRYLSARTSKRANEILVRPALNRYLIGKELSALLHKNVDLKLKNVFTYLAQKRRLKKNRFVRYLWHRGYRRNANRFYNYIDVVNAFYIATKINFTESYLMQVIVLPFPFFETKFRPYIYFLDAVIKNMQRLKRKYGLIRLTVTGKLAGGRKRTKVKSVGYGKFPKNSYCVEMTHQFAKFTHRFGEFGVKLLMGMKRRIRRKKRIVNLKEVSKAKKRREKAQEREQFFAEKNKVTNPLLAQVLEIEPGQDRPSMIKQQQAAASKARYEKLRLERQNQRKKYGYQKQRHQKH